MSTIKDLLDDAVKHEESALAHYIFFLLQEGRLQLQDDKSTLDLSLCYTDKFQDMWKNNVLGFDKIKIYSLKQSKDTFVFIFAESPRDARYLYWREYGQEPVNCMEMSQDEIISCGNRFVSFREIKKEMQKFPCILGCFERPNLTVRR